MLIITKVHRLGGLSAEQLVQLAIEHAVSVNQNALAFVTWAQNWLNGRDRSAACARNMQILMTAKTPPAAYLASGAAAEAALCLAEGRPVEDAVKWAFQWVSLIVEHSDKYN